jgi:hypothetical protein
MGTGGMMRLTARGARKTLVVAVMGCMGTHIPLQMETDVGRPSRWNTLGALSASCVGTTPQRVSCKLGVLVLWLGPEF